MCVGRGGFAQAACDTQTFATVHEWECRRARAGGHRLFGVMGHAARQRAFTVIQSDCVRSAVLALASADGVVYAAGPT